MLHQIQTKYMIALRQGTDIRPEDLGAVRLAMRMALEELHLQYRHDLADMDDILADLLQERDQLRATAATDAGEILRLQTMEDRLITWVHEHTPEMSDSLIEQDTEAVIINILNTRGGVTVAPPPAPIAVPVAVNTNGNGNGHVQITGLGTRYTGRRLNLDDQQVQQLAIDKIQLLAMRLGRTPTQKDWNHNLGPDEPSLSSVKNRLGKSWNELITEAGLTPNDSLIIMRGAKAAKKGTTVTEEEAPADNAPSTFRGE